MRVSNCSIDFLSTCGERLTESFSMRVGQRNRAGDAGAGALGGLDDLRGGLIDDAIVEALEFDANALAFHGDTKNEGLGAGRALGVGLDDLGERANSGPARSATA